MGGWSRLTMGIKSDVLPFKKDALSRLCPLKKAKPPNGNRKNCRMKLVKRRSEVDRVRVPQT